MSLRVYPRLTRNQLNCISFLTAEGCTRWGFYNLHTPPPKKKLDPKWKCFHQQIAHILIHSPTFSTLSTLSQLLEHFCNFEHTFSSSLSFWNTFSAWGTFSQIFAHFLILSYTFSAFDTLSQLSAHFLKFCSLFQTFSISSKLSHTFSHFLILYQLLAHFLNFK